jgi:hypothetical protein
MNDKIVKGKTKMRQEQAVAKKAHKARISILNAKKRPKTALTKSEKSGKKGKKVQASE